MDAETERKVRALVVFELKAAEVRTVVAHFFERFAHVQGGLVDVEEVVAVGLDRAGIIAISFDVLLNVGSL